MRARAFIHAAAGLGAHATPVATLFSGLSRSPVLSADAPPVSLRPLARSLDITLPRLVSRFGELAAIGARLCANQLAAPLPSACSVYLASGLGDVARSDALYYQVVPPRSEMPSPARFATSGNNMAAFFVAQQLQLVSRNLTVSQHDLSFENTLQLALDDLAAGATHHVLAGGVDETTAPREYYVRRYPLAEHHAIGEGSAWLVLASDSSRALGEMVGASCVPACNEGWAEQTAVRMRQCFGDSADITLLPGLRMTHAQMAALHALFPEMQMGQPAGWAGCYPTAVALTMVGTFAETPRAQKTFAHINQDAQGRTGILVWRVY